ncbi:hypothetical protein IVB12_16020 [Bradyrhizobium sp. 179]|uniref:hypothetical protein n=1 Tax=Bradyrhizobium sp. 179 TaxID=2782648 RepID=UPI001FFB0D1C|nr:hypothetical protein [Bradyrhizobium sp. 179]MCK1543424.1 hypothetical protein [Bradyrhizobium sp. 179]
MPSNTQNVKLGVCSVTFGGVDLGYTQGGVEVTVATTTKKVMVDQFGQSEINEYIMGRTCSAKVPLAETTLDNLVQIMPGATKVATGGVKATGTVTFSVAAPTDGDTVTVNGKVFTFDAAPAVEGEVATGATFAEAAANFAAAINASIDPKVVNLSASAAAGVVTITADTQGTWANSYALAKTGTNITTSGATLTGGADATKVRVDVPNGIGISLLASAKTLVLHPIANAPDDHSDDFVIPLANTPGAMQFSFKLDQERLFPVDFNAYPDSVTKRLFYVGDGSAA